MIKINEHTVVCAGSDQMSCDLNGEAAILQLSSGSYFGLDEVGARVWRSLQDSTSVGEIVRELIEEYEVGEEACRGDVVNLLAEMIEAGIVVIVDESDA